MALPKQGLHTLYNLAIPSMNFVKYPHMYALKGRLFCTRKTNKQTNRKKTVAVVLSLEYSHAANRPLNGA